MERGTVGCSVDLLLELSEIFDVSTDYLLLGRTSERNKEVEELRELAEKLGDVIRRL